MCSQNRSRFYVPSEQQSKEVSVPCLRELSNDQQKSCFLLSPTAAKVSLAPTWLPWQPRQLSECYDSCTRSCCRGSNWVPSDYRSDALSTRPSYPIALPLLKFVILLKHSETLTIQRETNMCMQRHHHIINCKCTYLRRIASSCNSSFVVNGWGCSLGGRPLPLPRPVFET